MFSFSKSLSLLVSVLALGASSAVAAPAPAVSAAASSTSTSTAAALPTGWSVAATSCIAEGTSGRALSAVSTSSSSMTVETCLAYCTNAGYPIAGIEFSTECYCGGILGNGASLSNVGSCNMKCSGNSNQTCGGSGSLTLYVKTKNFLSSDYTYQTTTSIPTGWSSVGCYAEPSTGRALDNAIYTSSSMTISMCLNYCAGKGFAYGGVEYGKECYCDDTFRNGANAISTSCNMPCVGAPQQSCGGQNSIQVYSNPSYLTTTTTSNGYAKQGCYQEVSGRAFTGGYIASNTMTVDTCTAYCKTKGFTYAAVEYGRECYCGSAWSNGASTDKYSTQCNMNCAGNSAQNCGGSNALAVYMSS